jgi:tartrate dehydratase beta subunit/fumarate hydratase class I family protein
MATNLVVPISEDQIRSLKVGDSVLLSGVMFTARDAAHKYMIDNFVKGPCPDSEKEMYEILKKGLAGGAIYHCGPVVKKLTPEQVGRGSEVGPASGVGRASRPSDEGGASASGRSQGGGAQASGLSGPVKYEFVAAGPTTSIREEPYQADVIGHFGVRAVIGKGGMRDKTLRGCQEHGAVYLHAIGGAAPLIAECVKEVVAVHKLEFGVPEALWEIRVEDFPAVVTMDSQGHSLHEKVYADSEKKLQTLLAG